MKNSLRTLFILVLIPFLSRSQQSDTDSTHIAETTVHFKNNVFIELGGTAGFYYIGYEREYYSRNKVSLYGGIEWSYRKMHPSISDPHMVFGINLLGFTYGVKHQLDIELSMAWGIDFTPFPNTIAEQLERKRLRLPTEPTFTSRNAIGVGYRYNLKEHWLLRIKALYMFKYDFEYKEYWQQPWGEIGFGYKF
ncbi:MAG: hypothetical protein ACI9EQ_001423 [Bacteroidia bacterium]|jgi:hypothetical protein